MTLRTTLLLLLLVLPALAQARAGQQEGPVESNAEARRAAIEAQRPLYPLETCVLTGEPLGDEPVEVVHEGQLLRFCCKSCGKAFRRKTSVYVGKVEQAVVAAQLPDYPLKECVVSGEPLGSMGKPIERVHASRLVRLCCKGCVRAFERKPESFVAKIDAAFIEAQLPSYPLTTCLVSGESLDANGGPENLLYGTRLVRLCCNGCKRSFQRRPKKFLAQLDAAAAEAQAKEPGEKPDDESGS